MLLHEFVVAKELLLEMLAPCQRRNTSYRNKFLSSDPSNVYTLSTWSSYIACSQDFGFGQMADLLVRRAYEVWRFAKTC